MTSSSPLRSWSRVGGAAAAIAVALSLLISAAPARAADDDSMLGRAEKDVAYEHEHLGVIGRLFCGKEVKWMDDRLEDLKSAVARGRGSEIDRNAGYVTSAVADLRRAEDSHA